MIPEAARKPLAALVISVAGVVGITQFEGFRDKAYVPVGGDEITIGIGSTRYPDGSKIKMNETITREQAENYLRHDLDSFHKAMVKCVKVPVSQNEYDAYISLTYNIGSGAFCGSTLVKKLNAYDYAGACKEILKWDKFKGVPLKGLTIRREKEYKQCLGVS